MMYVVKIVDEFILEDFEKNVDVEVFQNENDAKVFMIETFKEKVQDALDREHLEDLNDLKSNTSQYDYSNEENEKHLFYMDNWNYGRDITITLVEKNVR